ncbi:DUF2970 domain-containing protein [Idiomarina seosinensis]|uniref:DUF2970 domain-containing protein n=1 Tax=Idiomarina seosinensis TaxID=281739 RepID=UPI00384FEB64
MSQSNQKPGFLSTILSVVAAFFGVQSDSNRQRDFTHGKPLTFIIIGIALATLMVVGLIAIVQLVLANHPT